MKTLTAAELRAAVHPRWNQIPRSLSESWRWSAEWRHLYASHYLFNHRDGLVKNIPYWFPDDEKDPIIADLFSEYVYGYCRNPDLDWAVDTYISNESYGGSSKIKAFLLGGMTVPEIAKLMHTSENSIRLFLKAYFDVEDKLDCPNFIHKITYPYEAGIYDQIAPSEKKERLWLASAVMLKRFGLERIILKQFDIKDADSDQIARSIRALVNIQGLEHSVNVRNNNMPRPTDFQTTIAWCGAEAANKAATKDEKGGDGADICKFVALISHENPDRLSAETRAELDRFFGATKKEVVDIYATSTPIVREPPIKKIELLDQLPTKRAGRRKSY